MRASIRWYYTYLKKDVFSLPSKTFLFVFCLGLLFFPLITQNPYLLRIIILACIFAIYAASWDLLAGYTGQVSLGHALFFGIGAYTSALLNINFGIPHYLTIPSGAMVAVIAGLIVGIPALRLRGPYLGIATLAFPIMITGLIFMYPSVTGGELGLRGMTRLASTRLQEYYLAVLLMLGLCYAMWRITESKTGLIFHAIREDEIAVRASGINTTYYKLLAFSLSGFFAGIAGGLYAHFIRIAGPGTFDLLMSFQPIIWTIFGGVATIYGSVVGVFILIPLLEYLRVIQQYQLLLFAIIVILVLRFMPEGITPRIRDLVEKECPRCRARNAFTRSECRICQTQLE